MGLVWVKSVLFRYFRNGGRETAELCVAATNYYKLEGCKIFPQGSPPWHAERTLNFGNPLISLSYWSDTAQIEFTVSQQRA